MDFTKLKVAKTSIYLLFLLAGLHIANAQEYLNSWVPVYITIEKSPKEIYTGLRAAKDVPDARYRVIDTAYRWVKPGFNNLLIENEVYPVHLENFDDFNIGVIVIDSTAVITYSGAQGALKNEYLLDRHKNYTNYSKQIDLLTPDRKALFRSLDSLTAIWNNRLKVTNFSRDFKQDEQAYYESFRIYYQLFYDEIQAGNADLYSLDLSRFPKINYNNPSFYFTIPAYKTIAEAYHLARVKESDSRSDIRAYVNRELNEDLRKDLKSFFFERSLENHSENLYYASKPRYNPMPSNRTEQFKNNERLLKGNVFEFPEAYALNKVPFDFNRLNDKPVYLFTYFLSDPKLFYNLGVWRRFMASQGTQDAYYLTYALDGEPLNEQWREQQFNGNLPAVNLTSTRNLAVQFKKNYGIGLTPRVIHLNPDKTIADSNVALPFSKFDVAEFMTFTEALNGL